MNSSWNLWGDLMPAENSTKSVWKFSQKPGNGKYKIVSSQTLRRSATFTEVNGTLRFCVCRLRKGKCGSGKTLSDDCKI